MQHTRLLRTQGTTRENNPPNVVTENISNPTIAMQRKFRSTTVQRNLFVNNTIIFCRCFNLLFRFVVFHRFIIFDRILTLILQKLSISIHLFFGTQITYIRTNWTAILIFYIYDNLSNLFRKVFYVLCTKLLYFVFVFSSYIITGEIYNFLQWKKKWSTINSRRIHRNAMGDFIIRRNCQTLFLRYLLWIYSWKSGALILRDRSHLEQVVEHIYQNELLALE